MKNILNVELTAVKQPAKNQIYQLIAKQCAWLDASAKIRF
jgi:hypothetical protein